MVPPKGDPAVEAPVSLAEDLDRIEAAVAAGETDLRGLGFWRVVARVKPDGALVERHADQIGRIDTAAFRRAVKLRVPVWAGNTLLLLGVLVGGALVAAAVGTSSGTVAGLGLLGAAVVWSVSLHSPAHWVVGRAVGIRFTDYFLGGPPPPRPGLKTDYATYLRTPPMRRAWMHASGAIATKLAPFLALAFAPAADAPWWAVAGLIALGFFQIATDVLFSVKTSDWKKVARERALAKTSAPG